MYTLKMSLSLAPASASHRRLKVYLNGRRLWRWHIWLLRALNDVFQAPEVCFIESGPPLPKSVKLLLTLEQLVFGLSGEHACDLVDKSGVSSIYRTLSDGSTTIETVLNLSGTELPAVIANKIGQRILCPFFDGALTEDALINALLEQQVPMLEVRDVNQSNLSWIGMPAVENQHVLTCALDNMFSTLMRMCLKAAMEENDNRKKTDICAPSIRRNNFISSSVMRFGTKSVSSKAITKLTNMCTRAPGWFILWRWAMADRVHLTRRLPQAGYHRLRDDGRRFYADPFVVVNNGNHHAFFEEFDYAVGRGVISTTIISPKKQPETPRVVLERPYHLSYPFVFAHAGQLWMIPESSAARKVELYRAEQFPSKWMLEATLLSDISVADATVFMRDGCWWMLGSTIEHQSSSWDSLSVFHAPDLCGPWTAHIRNPVLIDSHSARPAGDVFTHGGMLWRPAQDCSSGYGSAITLCTIDRLDIETYEQSIVALLKPDPGWLSRRVHTLNWTAGLEVIDGWGTMLH